jgi:CDP-glucose 4,6-dehydratase
MGSLNMRDILSSYAGKRIFVTGHTGFKGAWLTFLLVELGADVRGFALSPASVPSHFELLKLQDRIGHVVGDIRDASALNNEIQEFQPEFVFHLAAQALVKRSYDNPAETFDTNVMGSVNLLDAVRKCDSVRSLVYITSDKCYENVEWIWGYRENDQMGGHDPYSASKGAAEIVFSAYARSYFSSRPELGAATSRAGNVIGGGDWADNRIIPDCIRAIEDGQPIRLRNPNATRPWQHVLEPLSGYLILGARLRTNPDKFSGSWNFGPSTSGVRTVEDVASKLVDHLGRGSIEIEESQKSHHEANLLQLNCDKANQLLNWAPRWGVEKTLLATAEWFKVYMDGGGIETITRTQLHNYYPELL